MKKEKEIETAMKMKNILTSVLPFIIVIALLAFMSGFKHDETLTEKEEQDIKTEITKLENARLTTQK